MHGSNPPQARKFRQDNHGQHKAPLRQTILPSPSPPPLGGKVLTAEGENVCGGTTNLGACDSMHVEGILLQGTLKMSVGLMQCTTDMVCTISVTCKRGLIFPTQNGIPCSHPHTCTEQKRREKCQEEAACIQGGRGGERRKSRNTKRNRKKPDKVTEVFHNSTESFRETTRVHAHVKIPKLHNPCYQKKYGM